MNAADMQPAAPPGRIKPAPEHALFNKLGIDTLDVLEAAGTKWNFLPFRPGLVGGHYSHDILLGAFFVMCALWYWLSAKRSRAIAFFGGDTKNESRQKVRGENCRDHQNSD